MLKYPFHNLAPTYVAILILHFSVYLPFLLQLPRFSLIFQKPTVIETCTAFHGNCSGKYHSDFLIAKFKGLYPIPVFLWHVTDDPFPHAFVTVLRICLPFQSSLLALCFPCKC